MQINKLSEPNSACILSHIMSKWREMIIRQMYDIFMYVPICMALHKTPNVRTCLYVWYISQKTHQIDIMKFIYLGSVVPLHTFHYY